MRRPTGNRPRIDNTHPRATKRQFVRDGAADNAGADDENLHGRILIKWTSRRSGQVDEASSKYTERAGEIRRPSLATVSCLLFYLSSSSTFKYQNLNPIPTWTRRADCAAVGRPKNGDSMLPL